MSACSLLQAGQLQLGEVFLLCDQISGSPLELFKQGNFCMMLSTAGLEAALQVGFIRSELWGRIPSLCLLPTLLWLQPRTRLAFWALSAHCQVTLSISSTNSPKAFFPRLLPTILCPACTCAWDYHRPGSGHCTWLYWTSISTFHNLAQWIHYLYNKPAMARLSKFLKKSQVFSFLLSGIVMSSGSHFEHLKSSQTVRFTAMSQWIVFCLNDSKQKGCSMS